MEVLTALESCVYEVPASLNNDLGPLVVLDLYTTPKVEILDKGTGSRDNSCKGFGRNVLIELRCIE